MSKKYNFSHEEINDLAIKRLSGVSWKMLANEYECDPDTIKRHIEKSSHFESLSNLFRVFDSGKSFSLANPFKPLLINGDLVADDVEITGKLKDGIIICDNVYLHSEMHVTKDSNKSPKEIIAGLNFLHADLGIMKKLKIGFIFANNLASDVQTGKGVKTTVEDIPLGSYTDNEKTYIELFMHELPDCLKAVVDGKDSDAKANAPYKPSSQAFHVKTASTGTITVAMAESKPIWNASNRFISITKGMNVYNADPSHPEFKKALALLVDDKIDEAIALIDLKKAVEEYSRGNCVIKDGIVKYGDIQITSGLAKRIVTSMREGEDFERYVEFLNNVMLNPSRKVVSRLFDFLQANDIEITDTGKFIAWKRVSHDYKDIHSGTFDNSPGKFVVMPRNQVDEDDNVTCSEGLHVCSKSYLDHYATGPGYRTLKVEVHPQHVVSIPIDYNNAKMRTCCYKVLEDVTDSL